jgi:NSS family neurotransmitter:Na+ symporter
MLPLGGIFIAIFVGWVMSKENVLDELNVDDNFIFKLWYFSIRYVSPVMVSCVFLYFFI